MDLDIDGDFVTVYMEPPGLERPLKLTIAEARAVAAALEVAGFAADSPLRAFLRTDENRYDTLAERPCQEGEGGKGQKSGGPISRPTRP